VIAAVNSVASVFYYLRWLAPMFFRPTGDDVLPATPNAPSEVATVRRRWAQRAAVVGAALVLILGVFAGVLLSLVGSSLVR
jgi:NADH-quinone oxidoreductase subunit N